MMNVATCRQWLDELYADHSGFGISLAEMNQVYDSGGSPVYGEITFEGTRALLECLPGPLDFGDVFIDLGSGIGRMCVEVFLLTTVGCCRGIELSPTRHKVAETIRRQLGDRTPAEFESGRILEFSHQDIMSADVADVTVAYCCNPVFSAVFAACIADKLAAEAKCLKTYISLKPVYREGWILLRRINLACTWFDRQQAFVYRPDG